jgi:hypothetical protein
MNEEISLTSQIIVNNYIISDFGTFDVQNMNELPLNENGFPILVGTRKYGTHESDSYVNYLCPSMGCFIRSLRWGKGTLDFKIATYSKSWFKGDVLVIDRADFTKAMKKCYGCGQMKSFDEFNKNKSKKDGLAAECKICKRQADALYREKNYDKLLVSQKSFRDNNKEKIKSRDHKYYQKNKEKISECGKTYRAKNEVTIRHYRQQYKQENRLLLAGKGRDYYQKNKKTVNQKLQEKYKYDIRYKLALNLRRRITKAIKIGQKSGSAVSDLGCSINEFKIYIEQQFQSEMSWDNYGIYGWHLDHIIPLASFDLTDRAQFLKACHYTNYQPLWAEDNLKKNDKMDWKK